MLHWNIMVGKTNVYLEYVRPGLAQLLTPPENVMSLKSLIVKFPQIFSEMFSEVKWLGLFLLLQACSYL